MPWQAFIGVEEPSDLNDIQIITDDEAPQKELLAQVAVAKKAARAILSSGELGDWENCHVHLSGHANPDHRGIGWQHDTISVSISVGKYK